MKRKTSPAKRRTPRQPQPRQSREIVEFIADHIGAPELRASFLNQPEVTAVLESFS